VQALMTMGQGFHPDYTGRENIQASLHYSGLSSAEVEEAFDEVVVFCELGPFLEQPFKTYSSGMQSRLMFATATAIRPDILVIEEVLGAGDAYFLAKSKQRGSGDPLSTRRAESSARLVAQTEAVITDAAEESESFSEKTSPSLAAKEEGAACASNGSSVRLQIPTFMPHARKAEIPAIADQDGRKFRNTTREGMSRWDGPVGIRIVGFGICGPAGRTDRLELPESLTGASAQFFHSCEWISR
jgi:lipopolysaccharide transport system ATP-binding protein